MHVHTYTQMDGTTKHMVPLCAHLQGWWRQNNGTCRLCRPGCLTDIQQMASKHHKILQRLVILLAPIYVHTFNGPFSGTTRVSRYQKGKTSLDFTEARDSEWKWHQLDHMQVCTSLQTDNHASTPPLSFLQAGCPSCRPTNSVKALKALVMLH